VENSASFEKEGRFLEGKFKRNLSEKKLLYAIETFFNMQIDSKKKKGGGEERGERFHGR